MSALSPVNDCGNDGNPFGRLQEKELAVFGVIHTIDCIRPSHGGPSRSVPSLVQALHASGECRVNLLTQANRGEAPQFDIPGLAYPRDIVSGFPPVQRLGLPFAKRLGEIIRASQPALLHDHGIWLPVNFHAARLAKRHGLRRLVHVRGMLSQAALAHHALRKKAALLAWQRRALNGADCLVVSSEQEAQEVRRFGCRRPLALIPNGIAAPEPQFFDSPRADDGTQVRTLLFLGRIHPIKGLTTLLKAWSEIRPPGWRLLIRGPAEGKYRDELGDLVDRLALQNSVTLGGEVREQEKTELFRGSNLLVLPSRSENFGLVVGEALAHGLPVIASRGTPWSDLVSHDCGWWVEGDVETLAATIKKATSLPDAQLARMGQNGRRYVRRFNWDTIAGQMIDVYRWLLDRGNPPESII